VNIAYFFGDFFGISMIVGLRKYSGGEWMKALKVVLSVLAIVFSASSPVGATLVTNGGFETIVEGVKFPGWTLSGTTGHFSGVADSNLTAVHSGNYAAYFGPYYFADYITQDIATTSGQSYTVDFWLKKPRGGDGLWFTALWNGVEQTQVTNPTTLDWTHYSYTAVATGATTPISFGFTQTNFEGWNFDDVSANPAASVVPIPGAIWLFGSGLGGLVGYGRWRMKK
jgi:hypothetical protein